MARKRESNWIARVNKYVHPVIHREKMANPFRRGTADVWYSGDAGDLWIEYKWLSKLPVRAPIDLSKLLEPLQFKWITERHNEGRNVAVCVGCPNGGVLFLGPNAVGSWSWLVEADKFRGMFRSAQEIGGLITEACLHSTVMVQY